jgi:uncharacterized caspase-like protein
MLRFTAYLLVYLTLMAGWAMPATAAKRVALVIGNSAYESAPVLNNPQNDAEAISAVLNKLGFEVVTGIDLKHVDFAQTVGQFRKKLKGADVGLFFYAGHGLQVNGENYLAPVDAELGDETSLDFETVPLRLILKLMERSTKTNLVFLDACRDNPLARNLARGMGTRSTAIGTGLARVESGLGTLITFATQPGNVALDGAGKNSPFATGMLKHMETPGLDVALVMRRVREEVIKATSGSQVPWSNSSLTGSFIFKDKPKQEANPASKPVAATPALPGVDTLAVELAYWQAAKDAGTPQGYQDYLRKYPKGNFAPLVSIKLDELSQSEAREAKQRAELEAAKKKKAEAEKAIRLAISQLSSNPMAAPKEQAAAKTAKRKTEAEKRQKELAALEKKQAEERESLATEREALARRLKALEEAAQKRAEAEKQKEQKLAALQPPELQPKPDSSALPLIDAHTMALVLQNELRRVGCDPGKVDGKWGKQGSTALAKFNVYAKLKLPTDAPTMDALEAIKGSKERVCPLICGPQFNKTGDQCVKKTCASGQKLSKRGQCIKVAVKQPTKRSVAKKKTPQNISKYKECRKKWGYTSGVSC